MNRLNSLKQLKANRNQSEVERCTPSSDASCPKIEKEIFSNSLSMPHESDATLGEISTAMEIVFGRYKATIQSISGVYSREMKDQKEIEEVRKLSDRFAELDGRRPRILVAKIGQDGHDRGAKVIATGFADLGFDVDIGPLFQTPEEVAMQAAENDVHIVGISSLAGGHKTLIPELIQSLKKINRQDILVVAGGVIPPQDYDFLYRARSSFYFWTRDNHY